MIKVKENRRVEFTVRQFFLLNYPRNRTNSMNWDYEYRMRLVDGVGEEWIVKRIVPHKDFVKKMNETGMTEENYAAIMEEEMYTKIIRKITLRNRIDLAREFNARKVFRQIADKSIEANIRPKEE